MHIFIDTYPLTSNLVIEWKLHTLLQHDIVTYGYADSYERNTSKVVKIEQLRYITVDYVQFSKFLFWPVGNSSFDRVTYTILHAEEM